MSPRRVFGHRMRLDSLFDSVSNNVGVLVILAAFAALLAVWQPFRPLPPPEAAAPDRAGAAKETRTLKVPWSRAASKNPVFATLAGGRVMLLNLAPVYEELLKRPTPRRPQPIDVRRRNVSIRFYPVTNEVYCFQFRLDEGAGEPVSEANRAGSAWTRERGRFDGERYFYFFWVAGDSFEQFRALRERLRNEGLEVGWKPVRPGAPLELCQGVDGGSSLVPQ